jgi:tripartite-type tricarboxylate transporter receptor subunit TctC
MVPAATPNDVIEKLSAASTTALKSQSVQDKLYSLGLDIVFTTPAEAEAYIRAETAKWSKLVKEAGIKVD